MTPQNMTVIEQNIVQQMASILPRQTDEALQECFGISWNTWNKLRKGKAIRRSVAERLLARLERSLVH